MKRLLTATAAIACVLGAQASADELRDEAVDYFKPLPSTVPAQKDNVITPEKIDLGKALFLIRVCRPRVCSRATRATTLRRVGTTTCRPRSVTAGRKVHATRRLC